MKRLYQAGDQGLGRCPACQEEVATRLEYRTFVPPGFEVEVADVLVEVCDRCGSILTIPPQSAARINAQRPEAARVAMIDGIQARIPRPFEEALDLVAATVGGSPKVVRSAVLRYYLLRASWSRRIMEAVKLRATDPLAECKADRKITVKVSQHHKRELMHVAKRCGVTSEAQFLRGVLLLIADDFDIEIRPCGGEAARERPPVPGASGRRRFIERLARVVS